MDRGRSRWWVGNFKIGWVTSAGDGALEVLAFGVGALLMGVIAIWT